MIEEIWKDIDGYEGRYQASTLGQVRSLDGVSRQGRFLKGKVLKQSVTKTGYHHLYLHNPGKNYRVNRLVAQTFIPNPTNLPQVNHIDGNKANNRVDNLEWCTQSENQLHAVKTGLQTSGASDYRSKPVVQLTLTGDVVAVYAGVKEAARITGLSVGNISMVLNKYPQRHTSGGYKWEFQEITN